MVDLPTIIESQKTIDRKTFYKTADISQMVICKEGEPSDEEDNSVPINAKKYDPNKVINLISEIIYTASPPTQSYSFLESTRTFLYYSVNALLNRLIKSIYIDMEFVLH